MCTFADRHRFRAELHWKVTPGEPDLVRMMRDYRSNLVAQEWSDVDLLRIEGRHGLTGRRGEEGVSRFGQFFPEENLLAELVLIHPGERDKDLEHAVVATLDWEPPDAGGRHRWRAFGMEMRVPATARMTECIVQPGSVGIRFDGPKPPERYVFRRFGMVDHWLGVSLRQWLAGQLGKRVRPVQQSSSSSGSLTYERATGVYRPIRKFNRKGKVVSSAWRHPGDNRLYHAVCTFRRNHPYPFATDRAEDFLTACPEFLVVPTPDREAA